MKVKLQIYRIINRCQPKRNVLLAKAVSRVATTCASLQRTAYWISHYFCSVISCEKSNGVLYLFSKMRMHVSYSIRVNESHHVRRR